MASGLPSRPGISPKELVDLRKAFDLFDTAKKGSISADELRSVVISLGFDKRCPSAFSMLGELEAIRGRQLTFEDFLDVMSYNSKETTAFTPEDTCQAFRLLDSHHKGSVNIRDLKKGCEELGIELSQREMEEMIARADSDYDGEVSMEDFQMIMSKRILQ